MPAKSTPAAEPGSTAPEAVVLNDGQTETLPQDAAAALVAAGDATVVPAEPEVTIVLLKPTKDFAAGRVITTAKALADPLLEGEGARLATAADQEIAWPFVERASSL